MQPYKHLTADERSIIQDGLTRGQRFITIAQQLGKDPTTIAKEVKKHRQVHFSADWVRAPFCHNWEHCTQRDLCERSQCTKRQCRGCTFCHNNCKDFEPILCPKLALAPYVCNGCESRSTCRKMQLQYSAVRAQHRYEQTRSASRSGTTFTPEELDAMTNLIFPLIDKQSIHHIVASNRDSLFCSERQIYRLIDQQRIGIKAIDLPRKVRFRPRKQNKEHKVDTGCRIGRNYEDYQDYLVQQDCAVVQIDTVEGKRGELNCLLTIYFPSCGFILIHPRPQNTASTVTAYFNQLRERLGPADFFKLFPLILTDNGSEFSDPTAIEFELDEERKTRIFYCDPGQSQQKGAIEQAHTILRRVLPKGRSFQALSETDCNRIASHVNSYLRKSLGDQTAYDLFAFIYGSDILAKLGIKPIPPRLVNLSPSLIRQDN